LEPQDYAGSLKKADELRQRTKKFAIRIVNLFRSLPRSPDAQTLGRQILRSGTSVAANYRAVCRARSKAEFISKMGIVVEEAERTACDLQCVTSDFKARLSMIQSPDDSMTQFS
jgi:four helix bundle protein